MTGNDIARRVARRLALALVALLIGASAHAQVKVTYVSNAGFLLEGGGKKVLIDALYDEGIIGYSRIPKDMKKLLRDADPPFDGVDLVLLTHHHADHFGPRTVTRHMRANPNATMICPPQVRDKLERHIKKYPGVAKRIVTHYPEEGKSVTGTYGGVEIEILNLHHGLNRPENTENLGFILKLGGMNVLHVGDTEARSRVFELYNFKERQIDVALLPAWLVSYDHWGLAVHEVIQPRHIVAMHMPLRDAPGNFFGLHGSYDVRKDTMKMMFPKAVLPETPGEELTFEPEVGE